MLQREGWPVVTALGVLVGWFESWRAGKPPGGAPGHARRPIAAVDGRARTVDPAAGIGPRRPRACHPHQRIDGRRASNFVSIVLVASDRLKSEATAAPFRKTRLRASSAAIGSPSATAKNT